MGFFLLPVGLVSVERTNFCLVGVSYRPVKSRWKKEVLPMRHMLRPSWKPGRRNAQAPSSLRPANPTCLLGLLKCQVARLDLSEHGVLQIWWAKVWEFWGRHEGRYLCLESGAGPSWPHPLGWEPV